MMYSTAQTNRRMYVLASRERSYFTRLLSRPHTHTLTHSDNQSSIPCGWNVFLRESEKEEVWVRKAWGEQKTNKCQWPICTQRNPFCFSMGECKYMFT